MSSSNVNKRKGKEIVEEEQHFADNPEQKKPKDEKYFEVVARK